MFIASASSSLLLIQLTWMNELSVYEMPMKIKLSKIENPILKMRLPLVLNWNLFVSWWVLFCRMLSVCHCFKVPDYSWCIVQAPHLQIYGSFSYEEGKLKRRSRDEKLVRAFKNWNIRQMRQHVRKYTHSHKLINSKHSIEANHSRKKYEQIRMGSTSTILNNYVFVSIALVERPCLMLLLILLYCNSIAGERKLFNGIDVGDEQMLNESCQRRRISAANVHWYCVDSLVDAHWIHKKQIQFISSVLSIKLVFSYLRVSIDPNYVY